MSRLLQMNLLSLPRLLSRMCGDLASSVLAQIEVIESVPATIQVHNAAGDIDTAML